MKATKKSDDARAKGIAALGKVLAADVTGTRRSAAVAGRGMAGWRVASTNGHVAILVEDADAPGPDDPGEGGKFWSWVACPTYTTQVTPDPGALGAAVRFMAAAARGQHRGGAAVPIRWATEEFGGLRLEYRAPGCACDEAIAVAPGEVSDDARGCVALGYVAPLLSGAAVDGWTWYGGAIGPVPVVELRAPGVRVVICEMADDNGKG